MSAGGGNTMELFQVKAWLKKKVEEIKIRNIIEDFKEDAKKFSPKYPKINYNKIKEKFLLEPDMPDLHFGKLTWNEESGEDYDIKIAEQMALEHTESIINQSSTFLIAISVSVSNSFIIFSSLNLGKIIWGNLGWYNIISQHSLSVTHKPPCT